MAKLKAKIKARFLVIDFCKPQVIDTANESIERATPIKSAEKIKLIII